MRIRINQIECRWSMANTCYEIVKWQPNHYYNKEQEYLENGWELSDGFFRKNNTSIDKTLFQKPETCYTVATLHYDRGEGCCNMTPVGPRLLDLDKTDRADFFAVYEYAEDKIHEEESANDF